MPIRRRGDRWQVDVQVNGRRSRCAVATKATAIEVERKLRADIEREAHGLAPHRTLEDALAQHLSTTATALRSYQSVIYKARIIRPYLNRPIERIADAAADIIRAGKSAGRSPATINRQLALLRRLGALAQQWGWVDHPAGKRVTLLPERSERHVYLTQEQVARLASCARSEAVRDAIWLAATTGLRRGEILALGREAWRDGCLWLATSKSGRPRRVPVPAETAEICERLPLALTPDSLRGGFEAARASAGLDGIRFHDLRHTYASWLIQGGADLLVVRTLLGHSTMQMTARYAHLEDRQLTRAVRRMGKRRVTPR